jgi:excisionase family DNA binding protein
MATYPITGPDAQILNAGAVCTYLGCELRTLRRWIEAGRFPRPRRVGRTRFWTGQDIAAYLSLEGRYVVGPQETDDEEPPKKSKKKGETPPG